MDYTLLIFGLLAVALLFGPQLVARAAGVKGVTPAALRHARERGDKELLILDVRSPGEFAGGHIKGAKHLPLEQVAPGAPLLAGLKQRKVVCVCASGKRSAVAAMRLKRGGFPEVYNLSGGMMRWGSADVVRD